MSYNQRQRRSLRSGTAGATNAPSTSSSARSGTQSSSSRGNTKASRAVVIDDLLGGNSQRTEEALTDSQISNQLNNMQMEDPEDYDNDDGDNVEEYGDMHRLVLQGVMSAGYMDAKGVKQLFQEAAKFLKCEIPPPAQIYPYIQKVVREINEKITNFDMMIRSATCEITGEKFYVFLVKIEKPMMKMQTYFTKVELELFQKIMNTLLRQRANFTMSKTDCINLQSELDARGFTKVNAEDFVDKMISMKYLTKVYKDIDSKKKLKRTEEKEKEYDITLGFRAIREFEPIFRDVYEDVFGTCWLCKTILLNGLICNECPAVFHRACVKKYIKDCKNCPSCNVEWASEDTLLVRTKDGGMAADSSHDGSSSSQDATQTRSSRSQEFSQARLSQLQETTGDDIDMPVLEPVGSPPARGSHEKKSSKKVATGSSATRSGKRKVISSDSD